MKIFNRKKIQSILDDTKKGLCIYDIEKVEEVKSLTGDIGKILYKGTEYQCRIEQKDIVRVCAVRMDLDRIVPRDCIYIPIECIEDMIALLQAAKETHSKYAQG